MFPLLRIILFNPSVLQTPPLYFAVAKHPIILRDTAGEIGIKKTQRYLYCPVIILQKTAGDEVPVFGYKCGVSVGEAGIGKQSVFAQIDE